jgi:hypothetical protein
MRNAIVARIGANSWIESRILEKVEFHGIPPPPPIGAASAVAGNKIRIVRMATEAIGSRRKEMRWTSMDVPSFGQGARKRAPSVCGCCDADSPASTRTHLSERGRLAEKSSAARA